MKLFSQFLSRILGDKRYSKIANYTDEYYIENHLQYLNSWYSNMVRLYYRYIAKYCMASPAKIPKSSRVLDIGCGVGILTAEMANLGFQAVGVDVNKSAIKNSICHENCMLVQTTAKLPFPNDYFDLIVSREVLEHIPESEIDACIKEWDRVGKGIMVHLIAVSERGENAICDPAHVNVQSEKWWINRFETHGYQITRNPSRLYFSHFGNEGYLLAQK